MECKFSKQGIQDYSIVILDGQEIPMRCHFKYLGSIIQKDEINSDVNNRIQAGQLKWRSAIRVLCDRNILLLLKGKSDCYQASCIIWHRMLGYKRYHAQKMSIAEMRMLRWMCGNTRRDKVRNEDICTKIGVAPIEEKMRENRIR